MQNHELRTYHGWFNYHGEIWEGETKAYSPDQAFYKLTTGMSRKYQVQTYVLRNYFLSSPARWEVR